MYVKLQNRIVTFFSLLFIASKNKQTKCNEQEIYNKMRIIEERSSWNDPKFYFKYELGMVQLISQFSQ